MLIGFSEFCIHWGGYLLTGVVFGGVICWIAYCTSDAFAFWISKWMMHIPIWGGLYTDLQINRFLYFLSLSVCYEHDFLKCLDTAKKCVTNPYLKTEIEKTAKNVSEGLSIAQAFERSQLFEPFIIRIINVGEKTGQISSSLQEINAYRSYALHEKLNKKMKNIQPIILVVLGGFILWIVSALFLPLYDHMGSIGL